MVPISIEVKVGADLSAVLKRLPFTMSTALNQSLYDTRDKMIRQVIPAAGIRGARRRRLTIKKQLATGRQVFRVQTSEPAEHPSGKIIVDVSTPASTTPGGLRTLSAQELIRAFVHSTSDVFLGKSKKDRIRMALGLYYRIRRGLLLREKVRDIRFDPLVIEFNRLMPDIARQRFPDAVIKDFKQSAKK